MLQSAPTITSSPEQAAGVTTPEQQLVCSDGTGPDPTTGLCADGSQPQPQSQSFNATAPGVTTPEQQLVCADGTGPDPTTGLCADGSQPQRLSHSMLQLLVLLLLLNNLSALTVLDQTQPPASVLMVHNHKSQSFNATAPGVTTPEQQLVCSNGTGPDPTTGLCADGSQPQPNHSLSHSILQLLVLLLLPSN